MIKTLILGSLLFLLVFGCLGSKPQTQKPVVSITDSDIVPSNPQSDPLLPTSELVVSDSDLSISENDSQVLPSQDLILASEDILIEVE
jgi:hypothetical protein